MYTHAYSSPIGTLTLAADEGGLRHILFPQKDKARSACDIQALWQETNHGFEQTVKQLDEYFAGSRKNFTIALSPEGTEFQQLVWQALQQISYGDTVSYGCIASQLGKPTASRAVGAANGANPIPIIIPCHRVLSANGKLTGFAGGLATKQWLLAHERGEGDLFCSPPQKPAEKAGLE
jgi:methylated-DNA-[protein]-cysteine S-methyltransferase